MLKFVVHGKKKTAGVGNKDGVQGGKDGKLSPILGNSEKTGRASEDKDDKDRCSASSHTSQDSDLGSMTQDGGEEVASSVEGSSLNDSGSNHEHEGVDSERGSTRSASSSRSAVSTSTTGSKNPDTGTLEKTYILDSQQDSSSGIASDDHNGTNSESSPTLSSSKEHFPRLGQTKPASTFCGEGRTPTVYPSNKPQDTYVQFQSNQCDASIPHEPIYSRAMGRPRMGFAQFHARSGAPSRPQQHMEQPRESYAQIWPPKEALRPPSPGYTQHHAEPQDPPLSAHPRHMPAGYPPPLRANLPTYTQHQQRHQMEGKRMQPAVEAVRFDDSDYFIPQATTRRSCVYHETDLDEPHRDRNCHDAESPKESSGSSQQCPSSPIRNCIRQATQDILSSPSLTNGFLSTSTSDTSLNRHSDEPQSVIPYVRTPCLIQPTTSTRNDFRRLPDDIVTRIFSNLMSDELCVCAGVCKRFYSLAWDPILWTCIHVSKPNIDIDKGLRSLTKRLSYETPTVCVMVERIVLSGCQNLTDKGLLIVANRCPELSYLDIRSCPQVTNIALFEVVSKCVNLETLNVSDCGNITTVCLTPAATLQAATYGKQVYLRYLDMTDCFNLEDSGLQILASYCSQLVYLFLRRCTKITDIGVQYVANYCSNLKEFSISDCWSVTDFSLRELAKLRGNLRYLSIAKCEKITDIGIKAIALNCHRLRYLNVRGCEAVSDNSIVALAVSCPRLRSLDVGKCDISDCSLQALAERCAMLKKLSVKSCESITDRGVMVLAQRCRHLQQLNVQDCNISVEAYRTVKKCCKRCIIEHTNPGFY